MERKYIFKNYRGKHKLRKINKPKEARKERGKKPRVDRTNRKHKIMILIKNKMYQQ